MLTWTCRPKMARGDEKRMKYSYVVAFLLVVSPQLSACAELGSRQVRDSGIYAEEADLVWLDNQRILFHGYKGVEVPLDPTKRHRFIDRALYLWDTAKGSIELYDTFVKRLDGLEGRSTLCVHKGVLTYVSRGMVLTGEKDRETRTPFPPQRHWYNPISCRYHDTRPFWVVEGHQTIPLLEEHGYLDLGTRPEPDYLTLRLENPNPAISFYSVNAKKSFPLPIGWLESRILQIHYAPFSNRYLLSGLQYYDEKQGFLSDWPQDTSHKVWWLSPDGSVQPQEVPNAISSLEGGWPQVFPILGGLFLTSSNTKNMRDPSAAGGFIIRGQTIKKLVTGMLKRTAVSPSGCRVAVVNDTYEKDKPVSERIRLQVVDLCQGD